MNKIKINLQSDLIIARKTFESNINKVCEFKLKENHCTIHSGYAIKNKKTKLQGIILKIQNKHVILKKLKVPDGKKFILNDLFMVSIYDIMSYKIL